MSNALTEADVAAVREVWDAMLVANFATDWDTYFQHVTEDVVVLDPRIKGPLRGIAATREWIESADVSNPDGSFTIEQISGSGDVACVVFAFEARWMEGGEQLDAQGKGLSLFQRGSDGTWRMSHIAWYANP